MYYIYYGQCFIYDAKHIDAEALPSIIIERKLKNPRQVNGVEIQISFAP